MHSIVKLPDPGEVVDQKFDLVREIGRGAFGIVFEARDRDLGRRVAIKMLLPHVITKAEIVERFQREARLASSLTSVHSVAVYGYGVHQDSSSAVGIPFMVMEYLEGEDLKEYMGRRLTVPPADATEIILQALASLEEGHARGIVHRDIKPGNIFLARDEAGKTVAKVLDFGIAKAVRGDWEAKDFLTLTQTGAVFGTPQYMAPEQAKGDFNLTPAADVYSIGCVAFEMVAGFPPFEGNSPMDVALKHMTEELPALPERLARHRLGKAIEIALRKAPSERFEDAGQFRTALETGKFLEDGFRVPWRQLAVALAVVAALVVVVVGLVSFVAPVNEEPVVAEEPAVRVRVSLRSNPPGAVVKVGTEEIGRTPLDKEWPQSEQPIQVLLEKRGYESRIVELQLTENSSLIVDLRKVAPSVVDVRVDAGRARPAVVKPAKPPRDRRPWRGPRPRDVRGKNTKTEFKVPLWKKK